jgi:putative transposase
MHRVVYVLSWCVKRRRPVLVAAVAQDCRALMAQICAEQGWQVLHLELDPTFVVLRVQVYPSVSAEEVVRTVKYRTSRGLRATYPDLWSTYSSLWTRAYFASTADQVAAEVIQAFVQAQKR